MTKKAELRARWSVEQLRALNECLEAGPVGPRDLAALGLPWSEPGDARGATIEAIVTHGVENLDLSYARFAGAGQLAESGRFTNVRFDHADIRTNLRGTFRNCSFARVNLRGAHLYGSFVDCSFAGCTLEGVMAVQTTFVRCSFEGANMQHCNLLGCSFTDCSFASATARTIVSFGDSTFCRSPLPESLLSTPRIILDGTKVVG